MEKLFPLVQNEYGLEKIQTYAQNSEYYYSNSKKLFIEKEFPKAGEFLWGAVAELCKAYGLKSGNRLDTHKMIGKFLNQLNLKFEGRLTKEIDSSHWLHHNFYENWEDEEKFKENYARGEKLLFFLGEEFRKSGIKFKKHT